jgi:hypothetical protein
VSSVRSVADGWRRPPTRRARAGKGGNSDPARPDQQSRFYNDVRQLMLLDSSSAGLAKDKSDPPGLGAQAKSPKATPANTLLRARRRIPDGRAISRPGPLALGALQLPENVEQCSRRARKRANAETAAPIRPSPTPHGARRPPDGRVYSDVRSKGQKR